MLLKSPKQNSTISTLVGETLSTGSFLITPDASGPGLVSVVSGEAFASPKQQSRGYLGDFGDAPIDSLQ